ncbi:MAG: putative polysaccharide biosynthesis protein [Frankiales bacterium]|nr:putative polysaccharide biosynthesis protein [Frankiales bacterium]
MTVLDRRTVGTALLRTLILGAGSAGQALARDLVECPELGLHPIGFLDDRVSVSPALPHLGRLDDLPEVARRESVNVVIVAIPSLAPARIAALVGLASAHGLHVRFLPSFVAALERDVRVADLRTLRVGDLLGRQEVHVISAQARAVVEGKRVLVTGAGGSIGSELCRQISRWDPAALFLLDHDESNLHGLQLELHGEALLDDEALIIADVRDRSRIDQVFATTRPDVVFHAAAHKHLPLLERHPCEGVKSNVLGTQNLLEAALEVGTDRFILISTDKAANPTSVLGASKRLAELLVRQAALSGTMQCASVRFGNVLGSRGSLLAVLSDQMLRGVPVTVTHPDVTRFFMTVEEAVGLVLEAGRMADQGRTFVLDMGEPVRIIELVSKFAAQVHVQYPVIRYTGLRPGEKLHEELFQDSEHAQPTDHPRISATSPADLPATFMPLVNRLYANAAANRDTAVLELFDRLLPEYVVSDRQRVHEAAVPYADGF